MASQQNTAPKNRSLIPVKRLCRNKNYLTALVLLIYVKLIRKR